MPTNSPHPGLTSDRPPRGDIRYRLRPARLPPRDKRCIQELKKPGIDLHLSTVGSHTASDLPWVNIGLAGSDLDQCGQSNGIGLVVRTHFDPTFSCLLGLEW